VLICEQYKNGNLHFQLSTIFVASYVLLCELQYESSLPFMLCEIDHLAIDFYLDLIELQVYTCRHGNGPKSVNGVLMTHEG